MAALQLLVVFLVSVAVQGRRFMLPQDQEAQLQLQRRQQIASACTAFDTTDSIYRTANGECNNVEEPDWGKAGINYRRHFGNLYDDSTNVARINAVSGNTLPNPRKVSSTVHVYDPNIAVDRRWTAMFMQFGQFLDHDITATPVVDDVTESCCTDAVKNGAVHPDVATGGSCFPINIAADDAYFGPLGVTCMDFKRSRAISSDPREQQNVITAFVDGSQVYGSSAEEQGALRSGVNGQLKVSNGENLPEDVDGFCIKVLESDYCLLAGDHRVNVFPGLAVLHTLFVRYHNQIATRIAEVKTWTDEQIFQEARKIVTAVLQRITYNEYLPEVLGLDEHKTYRLDDVAYAYESSLDPSLFNAFSTAAFRFGHSTIMKTLTINNTDFPTEDLFLRPYYALHHLESVVDGLLSGRTEKNDRYFVEAITNKLFITELGSSDLVALNINRGRDHGLPSYNDYREHVCGLNRIRNFESGVFGDAGTILSSVYESVDDIDLFTGGSIERNVAGGSVGQTFSCIIGKQFERLKFGDSFWFETSDSRRGFTQAQIDEIKKITLSRVLCDTIPDFRRIQPFAMIPPVTGNAKTSCDEIENFDLNILINNEASAQVAEATPVVTNKRVNRPFRLNNGRRDPATK